MTRNEIISQLRAWVAEWAIDPYDAREILREYIPAEGCLREDFGDYLDGAGYPNLATIIYENGDSE